MISLGLGLTLQRPTRAALALGPELITNGTFDSAAGWTLVGAAPPAISGGVLSFAANSGGASEARTVVASIAAGASVQVTFTASASGTLLFYVGGGYLAAGSSITAGQNTLTLQALTAGTGFYARANTAGSYTGTLDNISARVVLG